MKFKYLFCIGNTFFFYKRSKPGTVWWQKEKNLFRTDFLFGINRVFDRSDKEYIYKFYCGTHCLLWINFK